MLRLCVSRAISGKNGYTANVAVYKGRVTLKTNYRLCAQRDELKDGHLVRACFLSACDVALAARLLSITPDSINSISPTSAQVEGNVCTPLCCACGQSL